MTQTETAMDAEIHRLRNDFQELYLVIAALATDAGKFFDPDVTRALDKAYEASQGHATPSLLPFKSLGVPA